METKKQSYLEKYVDFLHEDGKGILENDLAVQIALGYMELKNPSPSLQPQQEYTQQELGLDRKSVV